MKCDSTSSALASAELMTVCIDYNRPNWIGCSHGHSSEETRTSKVKNCLICAARNNFVTFKRFEPANSHLNGPGALLLEYAIRPANKTAVCHHDLITPIKLIYQGEENRLLSVKRKQKTRQRMQLNTILIRLNGCWHDAWLCRSIREFV